MLVSSANGVRSSGQVPSSAKVRSREDEPLRVSLELRRQPVGVRARSDDHEQSVGGDGLLASLRTIAEHQVVEPPVAPAADDLGPGAHVHVRRRLHLADQVVRTA
jgi:hypothetical protein